MQDSSNVETSDGVRYNIILGVSRVYNIICLFKI